MCTILIGAYKTDGIKEKQKHFRLMLRSSLMWSERSYLELISSTVATATLERPSNETQVRNNKRPRINENKKIRKLNLEADELLKYKLKICRVMCDRGFAMKRLQYNSKCTDAYLKWFWIMVFSVIILIHLPL